MADFEVTREARRLEELPTAQARAQFGDRVARTFQLTGAAFAAALQFNAHLVTELRERAETGPGRRSHLWSTP